MEWPFLVLFFVLAGASFEFDTGFAVALLVVAYIVARTLGTSIGVQLGGKLLRLDPRVGRWLSGALLPQAGVALGLALAAAQRFPAHGETILRTILLSTVILEALSPVLTRAVLKRAEEENVYQDP